ncbi:MAG TPA: hypothetical protein VFD58_33155 [Blastocatellia bacterium]|nr:hypothetical protein [Blastocatellia bacterium]
MKRTALIALLFLSLLTLADRALTNCSPVRAQEKEGSRMVPRELGPYAALSAASRILIVPKSAYFNPEALERELLKRSEFKRWGMVVVRDRKEADLLAEVTRKKWTTRFTIRLIDPVNNHVLAAEEASSLGGEIEPKLADRFVKLIKEARAQ